MMTPADRRIVREYATRVAEIAALPMQQERIALWKQHNALKGKRPMLLVFPEGSWGELLPATVLRCEGEEARRIEWELRARIYYHEHLQDDNPVMGSFDLYKSISDSGWGLAAERIESPQEHGAWKFKPVVEGPADLKKLKFPTVLHDERKTQQRLQELEEAMGDILPIRLHGVTHHSYHLMAQWTRLRGLEQMMMDMVEAPEFLHDAMRLLTEGHKAILRQFIEMGLLDLNNNHTYQNSGGNGWTDELPRAGFDGRQVRPMDMWCSAESQELSAVSPAMHAEFALRYEKELLAPWGLNGYGCCEPLHQKLEEVLTIPNIRRISISPWADVQVAAEKLGRKAIFSWKPMPAMLCGDFDEQHVRKYLRRALEATRGCIFEMILKDTHTIDHQPQRMHRWLEIAREEIEREMAARG